MITINNIVFISDNINKNLKELKLNNKVTYNLYSDEGGFLGNPVFYITKKINNKIPYTEYHGKMNKETIAHYILGRLCTWQIANSEDYSDKFKIVLK